MLPLRRRSGCILCTVVTSGHPGCPWNDCAVIGLGNRSPATPMGVGDTRPATRRTPQMPKIRNLAALAAAVEAARRYARSNPDKAAKYLDQAADFVDKQTKGKYSNPIHGLV